MATDTAPITTPSNAIATAVRQLGSLVDWLGEDWGPLTDKLYVWAGALTYEAFPPATIAAEIRAEASGWYDYSATIQGRLLDCAQAVDTCAAAREAA